MLDDAFSIQKIDENKFLIGIHIADLAEVLKKGSILD